MHPKPPRLWLLTGPNIHEVLAFDQVHGTVAVVLKELRGIEGDKYFLALTTLASIGGYLDGHPMSFQQIEKAVYRMAWHTFTTEATLENAKEKHRHTTIVDAGEIQRALPSAAEIKAAFEKQPDSIPHAGYFTTRGMATGKASDLIIIDDPEFPIGNIGLTLDEAKRRGIDVTLHTSEPQTLTSVQRGLEEPWDVNTMLEREMMTDIPLIGTLLHGRPRYNPLTLAGMEGAVRSQPAKFTVPADDVVVLSGEIVMPPDFKDDARPSTAPFGLPRELIGEMGSSPALGMDDVEEPAKPLIVEVIDELNLPGHYVGDPRQ